MEITVMGTGRAAQPPERATIHLSAGFEGGDQDEVLTRTTQLVNALVAEIARLKEHESEPTTWSAVLPIGTRSWRPWSDQGAVLPMRYAASSRIQVKFRDFRALSGFTDAWGRLDGVTLGGVEWTLTEQVRRDTERRVRVSAVEDARDRAQVYATAAGGGVVRCVQVADPGLLQDNGRAMDLAGAAPRAMRAGAAKYGGGDEGIEIAPEDVEIEAVVHARFIAD
jgi:uncharacterized protein YggE